MNKTVEPHTGTGTIRIPSSKSVVHRQLICAALGERPTGIALRGLSDDILATATCLDRIGMRTQITEDRIRVFPMPLKTERTFIPDLPCGESGSTLRFLLPVAGALGKKVRFLMRGRLSDRPLEPFGSLLQEHGMVIRREDTYEGGKTLLCSGQLSPGCFTLPGNISSQFFTGLMLALPLLKEDSVLRAEGLVESEGYLHITERVLQDAGIVFEKSGPAEWQVPGRQVYRLPENVKAEGDWSSAAFPLCLGALSEPGVTVMGLDLNSLQGDKAILNILHKFGAITECEGDTVHVRKGKSLPLIIDASAIPDLIPVVSILACAADGESRIDNAARLRLKESDRLSSTAQMIAALGGTVKELPDGLIIHGTGRLKGGTVDAYGDHRIAMSAAVAAAVCDSPVTVLGAECVNKSYPSFWKHIEELRAE